MSSRFLNLFEFRLKVPPVLLERLEHAVIGEWAARVYPRLQSKRQDHMMLPDMVKSTEHGLAEVTREVEAFFDQEPEERPKGLVGSFMGPKDFDTGTADFTYLFWRLDRVDDDAWRLSYYDTVEADDRAVHTIEEGEDYLMRDIEAFHKKVISGLHATLNSHHVDRLIDNTLALSKVRKWLPRHHDGKAKLPITGTLTINRATLKGWEYLDAFNPEKTSYAWQVDDHPMVNGSPAAGYYKVFPNSPDILGAVVVGIGRYMDITFSDDVDRAVDSLRDTCEHELGHLLQYWLGDKVGASTGVIGLPPRRAQSPIADPHGTPHDPKHIADPKDGRVTHGARDIEFQTNMMGMVRHLTHVLGRYDPKLRREVFQNLVGLSPRSRGNMKIRHSQLGSPMSNMPVLAQDNPEKWKVAVKYLYREMQNRGLLT